MTERPEQIRAREYLRDKGSLLPVSQIHERVGAAFAATETLLDGVTEGEARRRAIPGEWTIQEVVDHLVETHRPSIDELRDLPAGPHRDRDEEDDRRGADGHAESRQRGAEFVRRDRFERDPRVLERRHGRRAPSSSAVADLRSTTTSSWVITPSRR